MIIDDTVYELTESFSVSISQGRGSPSPRVTLTATTAQVTILDNDGQ